MTMARHLHRPARQRRLLATTSIGAGILAALALSAPARAQSFQGTGSVASGDALISTGADTTNVLVRTPQTVINWTPSDQTGTGTVNFQPAGTTASFQADTSIFGFTVLNRVLPTNAAGVPTNRPIAFNGTVNGNFGGNIWFYSPGGIIIGGTAAFNVGGLVLTTNDIDTTGGLYDTANNNAIRFGVTAPVAGSFVQVNAGAQVNAGNYVAMVSPRIVQGGTVTVSGSTAYVAAEKASISINGGLFDIRIDTGTSDPDGIVHTGTTTGPATGITNPQRVYLVSLAKNDALTMLLSGTIGYTPASVATDEGGAVVLTAGGSVTGGDPDPIAGAPATIDNFSIANARFLSPFTGYATGRATISAPTIGQDVVFGNTAGIFTRNGIDVTAQASGVVSAAGDLTLASTNGPQGGTINILADGKGSALQVQGTLFLYTSAYGVSRAAYDGMASSAPLPNTGAFGALPSSAPVPAPATGADGIGGAVNVTASGGIVDAGALYIYAQGQAGSGTDRGGRGTGGAIALSATGGGQIGAPGLVVIDADGFGDTEIEPLTGGDAVGGTISLTANGGNLAFEDLSLEADARAGSGDVANGNAVGGSVAINIANTTFGLNSLSAYAISIAQDFYITGVAGTAVGSANGVSLDIGAGGSLSATQFVSLDASSISEGSRGNPLPIVGGVVGMAVHDGGSLTTGQLYADVSGSVVNADNPDLPDSGAPPVATGGTLGLDINGGLVTLGSMQLRASGSASGGRSPGGLGTGGTATVGVRNGGTLTATDLDNMVDATGYGGYTQRGASGTGGTALVYVEDGTVDIGQSLTVSASGGASPTLDSGPAGGIGTGGSATFEIRPGTAGSAQVWIGQLMVQSIGDANYFYSGDVYAQGDGAAGIGGRAAVNLLAGTFNARRLLVSAGGNGGNSVYGTTGGTGTGGSATLLLAGATADVSTVSVLAEGQGGLALGAYADGSALPAAGRSGMGVGGNATLTATGGTLTTSPLLISANGTGGEAFSSSGADGSAGGDGRGGTALLSLPAGSTAALSIEGLTLTANGLGANGGSVDDFFSGTAAGTHAGDAGAGFGGTAQALLEGGTLGMPTLEIHADGSGGAGGDSAVTGIVTGQGGQGSGGVARISLGGTALTTDSLSASARGTGGGGGLSQILIGYDSADNPIYQVGDGPGGTGGMGAGGASTIAIGVDPDFSSLTVAANAIGGAGGSGASGGAGGSAMGGIATLSHDAGALSVSDTITVSGIGSGGNGGVGSSGVGGNGGSSVGGSAVLAASGAGTTINVGTLSIDASAAGGFGGTGATQGGSGGAGNGGSALLSVSGGAALTYQQGASVLVEALGGIGGAGNPPGGGGAAQGGSATVMLDSGTMAADNSSPYTSDGALSVSSIASGGEGGNDTTSTTGFLPGGVGGGAIGGSALLSVGNGATATLRSVGVLAATEGGYSSTAGAGGTARGGSATVRLDGGTLTSPYELDIQNYAIALADGAGSPGIGGLASLEATAGTLNVPVLQILEQSEAGGRASLANADGAVTIGGDLTIAAATSGVNAGDGVAFSSSGSRVSVAGAAQFTGSAVDMAFTGAGGLDVAGPWQVTSAGAINADHVGQPAAMPFDSVHAAQIDWTAATDITGNGQTRLRSDGAINLTAGGAAAFGSLFAGTDIQVAAAGDIDGQDATAGGLIGWASTNGHVAGASLGAAGAVTLAGPSGVSAADVVAGGDATLTATDGAVLVSHNIAATGQVVATGRSVTLNALGDLVVTNATASAGGLVIDSGGALGLIAGSATGDAALTSAGAMTIAQIAAGGALDLQSGDTLTVQAATLGTDARFTSAGAMSVASLDVPGIMSLTSGAALTFGTGTVGGVATLQSGGPLTVDSLRTGGALSMTSGDALTLLTQASGADVTLTSAGDMTLPLVAATGTLDLASGGALSLGNGTAGSDASLTSGGAMSVAQIAAGGALGAQSGGALMLGSGRAGTGATLFSQGALSITSLNAGGALDLQSQDALTAMAATAGTDASLRSAGPMSVGSLDTTGAMALTSDDALTFGTGTAGGNAAMTSGAALNVTSIRAGGALMLSSGPVQALQGGRAAGTQGSLGAPGDGTLVLLNGQVGGNATFAASANASVGTLAAGGAVSVNSGGIATFTGSTVGTAITVQSNDIAIGNQARLGQAGTTTQVSLISTNGAAAAVVGGPDPATAGNGYVLSAAEFARLFANGISIAAPRVAGATPGLGGTADLIVRDLTVSGGATGNLPATGLLSLATPGSIRVEGALALRGFAGGGLAVTAGDTLSVIAGAGSIDLSSGQGVPSGHADLTAGTIVAATPQAIADLASSPAATQRTTRLGQNDGVLLDQGMVRADALTLTANSGVFVQNTGASQAFADRRGFTANSIRIVTGGPQTQIVINGQLLDSAAAGGAIQGQALIPRLSINGLPGGAAGRFDLQSTANGCLIASSSGCTGGPQGTLTEDQLDGKLSPPLAGGMDTFRLLMFQTSIRNGYPPLIDEPITGVGNEDLWNAGCGANGPCAPSGNGQP